MKKLLFTLLLFPLYIFTDNALEKAILEINLKAVEEILIIRAALSDKEKLAYLDLAQQKIQEINDCIYLDNLWPRVHSAKVPLSILGLIISGIGALAYFENYDLKRDGEWPIIIASCWFGCLLGYLRIGCNEEACYQAWMIQAKIDAAKIKQRIFHA